MVPCWWGWERSQSPQRLFIRRYDSASVKFGWQSSSESSHLGRAQEPSRTASASGILGGHQPRSELVAGIRPVPARAADKMQATPKVRGHRRGWGSLASWVGRVLTGRPSSVLPPGNISPLEEIQVVWGGFQHLSSKVVGIDGIDDSEFTRHLLLTSPCYFPEHPSGSSRLQSSCARAASESPRGLEVSFVTVSPQLGTYLTSCRYPEIFTRSQ